MAQAANPIQHNFESVTSAEELKHLCPAFAQTCPFARKDEVQSLTIMNDKLKKWYLSVCYY
jgi:hypothetical protein